MILELDRRPVRNADEAVRLSEEIQGPKVMVRLWRDGRSRFVVVDESKGSQSENGGWRGVRNSPAGRGPANLAACPA